MKALGIILAGGNNYRMRELSDKRAIAAMPVGGGYRAIDFALSNMSNSHIQRVAVLTQYNSRSLNEHLNSSKWWDFGRKQGGLYIFTPTITADNGNWYRGTADALAQNIDFLKRSHEPYVIVAGGDCVYKLDYNKVLDYHIQKKADITIVCKDVPATEDVSRFGVVQMNEESRIIDFEEKPMVAQSHTISTGIYVLRRRQLIEMLEKSMEEHRFDFVTDILIRYGGDEFLLLFPRMTEEAFLDKKKQIQQAVHGIRMSEFADVQLSVSIGGICGVHPITEAIRKADYLMYLDKAEQKS